MRGWDAKSDTLFSYVSCEARVPKDHPLRPIRHIVDEALTALSPDFERLYAKFGRPSTPPERLLRALLLQALYSVRSEAPLMEQLDYNLLFRWFVGLSLDTAVWNVNVFTKNRERLIEGDIARKLMAAVLNQEPVKALLSDDHFSVDDTLIEAWASMKSFRPKDGSSEPPAPGRNGERDFHGEKRSNETHASKTDPDARLLPQGTRPAGQTGLSGARSDGEPTGSAGRHASDPGHRDGRTRRGTGNGGRPSRQPPNYAWCRQGLRCRRVCRQPAGMQRDAACDAEHHQPALRDRRSDDPPPGLCGQRADAQAHRGG